MTVVLFVALIWQVIDFLRELFNLPSTRSSVLTQLAAWVVGIGAVWIGTAAVLTKHLVLPGLDVPLGQLDAASIVLAGLLVASTASSVVDLKQAFDNKDSAAKPPLLGP